MREILSFLLDVGLISMYCIILSTRTDLRIHKIQSNKISKTNTTSQQFNFFFLVPSQQKLSRFTHPGILYSSHHHIKRKKNLPQAYILELTSQLKR